MKLLVCIKQVADTEADLKINIDSSWIAENDRIAFRMNRYDEYALEEALLIKDAIPGVTVDVISVGPERAVSVLKKSLEKGADNAIHIKSENPALTAAETSSMIAEYASGNNYDIIFTGVMSEDLMQGQVGPMIASLLSVPCAVSVICSEYLKNGTSITVKSELEGGVVETIRLSLPCVITVQTGVDIPRYPSLSNVMRARSMQIISLYSESFRTADTRDRIESIEYPPVSSKGIVLGGSSGEKAAMLIDLFHEKGIIMNELNLKEKKYEIIAVLDTIEDKLIPQSLELIAFAETFTSGNMSSVLLVVPGSRVTKLCESLTEKYGIDTAVLEHEKLYFPDPELLSGLLTEVIIEYKPEMLIFSHTMRNCQIVSGLSVLLKASSVTAVESFSGGAEGYIFQRSIFNGQT